MTVPLRSVVGADTDPDPDPDPDPDEEPPVDVRISAKTVPSLSSIITGRVTMPEPRLMPLTVLAPTTAAPVR